MQTVKIVTPELPAPDFKSRNSTAGFAALAQPYLNATTKDICYAILAAYA
jgi:hypothetical protein